MGCCFTQSNQKPQFLTVATLNYSGILTSPYEYYQYDNQKQRRINKIFQELTVKKYPNFNKLNDKGQPQFKWCMGSIDTKWKDRYAPINILDAGIKKNGMMMNQQQFIIEWQQKKQQTIKVLQSQYFKKKVLAPGENLKDIIDAEIQRCKQFDLLTYQTFLKAYCNVSDFKNTENVESKVYFSERKKQFDKPFLNQSIKLNKTINSINSIGYDILFFQQTNRTLIQGLTNQADNYHVISKQNSGSVILLKKFLCRRDFNFEKSNKLFLQKYQFQLKRKLGEDVEIKKLEDRLNFNRDSIFQGFEKFLLINVHISSRKQVNHTQIKNFTQEIRKILTVLPDYQLICGGDFNARLKKEQILPQGQQGLDKNIKNKINIAPDLNENSNNILSVKKKRTLMQPQRHKAQILDQQTKDFLISTMKMTKKQIILINGEQIEKHSPLPLLPNTLHPYDHYMILVQVQSSNKNRIKETLDRQDIH